MKNTHAWVLSGALLCGLAAPAPAQVPEPGSPLVVGTKVAPPFSMKGPDGAWTGIGIDSGRIGQLKTVSKLGPHTRGPADLPGLRVAAIADSTGGQYLDERRISYQAFPDALGALRPLAAEQVDAVVYDAPILK